MTLLRSAARIAISGGCVLSLLLGPSVWAADPRYVVRPVAEMKVKQLPNGPLYWRVEIFPTLDQAKTAASLPLEPRQGPLCGVAITDGRSCRQSMAVHARAARRGDGGRNQAG